MPAQTLELQPLANMDRVKRFFQPESASQPYQPIQDDSREDGESTVADSDAGLQEQPFSWVEYFVFMLLGVAMLWAWYVDMIMDLRRILNEH